MQEMIHYRNSLEEGEECDPEVVSGFEARYRQILQKAKEEYEYLPPNKYYKKGHNFIYTAGGIHAQPLPVPI